MPVRALSEQITLDDTSALSISLFHHSYLWLESNNALAFRNHIERTSDVALTGHQHYRHDYYKTNITGERVLYIEGDALQGESFTKASAFGILLFDLEVVA